MVSSCFLGVSSWVWSLFWGILGSLIRKAFWPHLVPASQRGSSRCLAFCASPRNAATWPGARFNNSVTDNSNTTTTTNNNDNNNDNVNISNNDNDNDNDK